jgi:hypothetical protein
VKGVELVPVEASRCFFAEARQFPLHSFVLYPPAFSFGLIAVGRYEPNVFPELIKEHLVSGQYDTTSY